MDISAVKHTIKLSSFVSFGCPYCLHWMEGEQIDESINHLIQVHQATLLHVGPETYTSDGSNAIQTVAILGSDEIPPKREPTAAQIQFTVLGKDEGAD